MVYSYLSIHIGLGIVCGHVLTHPHIVTANVPSKDNIYVSLLPYCIANGCQNTSPHPASKNMYPVPSLILLTEIPDCWDRGTMTEYTTEVAIPVNRVYLDTVSIVVAGE